MKKKPIIDDDEMLSEYDFSNGVRGKYASRLAEENGYIKIDPLVAKYFKTSEEVNKVLLGLINPCYNKFFAISKSNNFIKLF